MGGGKAFRRSRDRYTMPTPSIRGKGKLGMGKGFCYDKTKVDLVGDNYVDPACDKGEYCVPRKHFTLGGDKAKTCDFMGKPGACASLVATEMAQSAAALQQGPCDEDEKCSPCIDPRNGKPSGVCDEIGVHEQPCVGGKGSSCVTLCCAGLGVCLGAENVPGGAADSLPADSCKGDKVCAPASLVDGKPQKCDAIGGLDGVCLPFCFAEMVKGVQAGLRSSCNALSFCLPCAAAKSQGMQMPGCE
jgi:hypothetical protein